MNRQSFVVSGPNGSGKSGVVDAIQFALTGEIGRLTVPVPATSRWRTMVRTLSGVMTPTPHLSGWMSTFPT